MVLGAADGDGGKQVTPSAWRPAWYRLRAGSGRYWARYLAIAVIVGLLGGVAMASVAAARRTQSAFPRILAASNASDLDVDPGPYSARVAGQISRLPGVRSAESYVALYTCAPCGLASPIRGRPLTSRWNSSAHSMASTSTRTASSSPVAGVPTPGGPAR